MNEGTDLKLPEEVANLVPSCRWTCYRFIYFWDEAAMHLGAVERGSDRPLSYRDPDTIPDLFGFSSANESEPRAVAENF